jgi:hypothetical protein
MQVTKLATKRRTDPRRDNEQTDALRPADTSKEADDVQTEVFRRMSPQRRSELEP